MASDKKNGRGSKKGESITVAERKARKVAERLAREAKSSETLSAVWSLPPAQLLRFHSHTHLVDIDAGSKPGFDGDQEAGERFIADSSSEIANYQRLMYANGIHGDTHRVLIVLQGMDASGKGGIVRHVFSQVDPMGIHYHGFGKPSEEDLAHDYLWRIRRELPSNGWISIFDRSQYEDIVMPRITGSLPEETWRARYGQINDFEAELAGSGCAIIKIFLVSSRQAQRQHFLRRLDDPTRYWKFDHSDLEARGGEYFVLDTRHEQDRHEWTVRQIIDDSDGDHDWAITGTVNLDATQESGEVVFTDYSVRDVVNDNDAATVKAQ